MKKYQVLQGKVNRQGNGQIDLMKEFDTLEAAQEYFNDIKNDKRGYGRFINGEVLETWLIEGANWEDPVGYWNC